MTLTRFLMEYGYLAVFAGCLLEGETILLLAGFAAHEGYLSAPVVVLVAFCGGALGDQVFFLVGRSWGIPLLGRVGWIRKKVPLVSRLLVKHDAGLIFAVRFLYGIRIAGPVVIGMSEVSARRFMIFNVLGAAVWAVVITGAGYLFGHSMKALLPEFGRYQGLGALALVGVMLLVGLAHRIRARRSA